MSSYMAECRGKFHLGPWQLKYKSYIIYMRKVMYMLKLIFWAAQSDYAIHLRVVYPSEFARFYLNGNIEDRIPQCYIYTQAFKPDTNVV